MEPSTTKKQKIQTIRELMDERINQGKNLFHKNKENKLLQENYEAIKEAIFELMLRNVSEDDLSYVIKKISSSDYSMTTISVIFYRMKKLNKHMKQIKNRGVALTSDIIGFVEHFTSAVDSKQAEIDVAVGGLNITIPSRNDQEPIFNKQQDKETKINTIRYLINKVINNSPTSLKFLATIREKHNKIEEPMSKLILTHATNKDLDKMTEVLSNIEHQSAQAMRSFNKNLDKIIEREYIDTKDISDIMNSLIERNTVLNNEEIADKLKLAMSSFENKYDIAPITVYKQATYVSADQLFGESLDNKQPITTQTQQSQNVQDTNIEINPEPTRTTNEKINTIEPSATRDDKIKIIRSLTDELFLNTCSNENKEQYKSVEEGYKQTIKPMLTTLSKYANDENLDDVIDFCKLLSTKNKINSPKTIECLKTEFNNITQQGYVGVDDIFTILHRVSMIEVSVDLDDLESRLKFADMHDKFEYHVYKFRHHTEPITTLTNQPQNTTETNKINKEINK